MGTSLRNRLCTFQAFSALYQVKQVPKSRETRFKLVFFLELTGRSQVDLNFGHISSADGKEMYKKM